MPLHHRLLATAVALALWVLAVPAVAQATSVSVRVEATSGTLVPWTTVTLPTAPVAPPGALDGQTCPGNSVIGALHAATAGQWNGVWSDTTGWSVTSVKSQTMDEASGRKWVILVNRDASNTSPCQVTLNDADTVYLYSACLNSVVSGCFHQGPLELTGPATTAPGALAVFTAYETRVTFDESGNATASRVPSLAATVAGPNGSALTDSKYGFAQASLLLADRGQTTVSVAKATFITDRIPVCVTDGADGYCGTSVPPTNPFNPLDYCQTTGDDGECGSIDLRAPVGHIAQPTQAKSFAKGKGPETLQGTVDRDPSQVQTVDLRLKRQLKVTVKKTIRKRVRNKKTRKIQIKKRVVKRTETRCYGWSSSKLAWVRLKSCTAEAGWFKANGDEYWTYDFTAPVPAGSYTLDARATDGKGNVESAFEQGRNRVAFTVK